MQETKDFVIKKREKANFYYPKMRSDPLERSADDLIRGPLTKGFASGPKISVNRSNKTFNTVLIGGTPKNEDKEFLSSRQPKKVLFSIGSGTNQGVKFQKQLSNEDALINGNKTKVFSDLLLQRLGQSSKFFTSSTKASPAIKSQSKTVVTSIDNAAKVAIIRNKNMTIETSFTERPAFKSKTEIVHPYITPTNQSSKQIIFKRPPQRVPIIFSASETRAGHNNGAEKENQDFMLHKDYDTPFGVAYLRLVADGHGTNGHIVSQMVGTKVSEEIFTCMREYTETRGTPYAEWVRMTLEKIFEKVDDHVLKSSVDVRNSGSTLTVALIWQSYLAVAYVGDSKALLLSRIKNLINVAAETSLHHPGDPTEMKRVEQAGGVVSPICKKEGEYEGPMRVWKADMTGPGLAVARSFGDSQGKMIGVICKPEFLVKKVDQDDRALVIASDGLWEYLPNKLLVSKLVPLILLNNPKNACRKLVKYCSDRWDESHTGRDDITIELVIFH